MDKVEQLNCFISASEDFIESKYILADVKISNILRTIVSSETILALFKNCLQDFDYESAKRKYLVKSQYLSSEKGEYIQPSSTKELLAFTFSTLADLDSKKLEISAFLNKYFYEDGSFSSGYSSFINTMFKPFYNSTRAIMESVIEGKIQDPVDVLTKFEAQQKKQKELDEQQAVKDKELSKKAYGDSILTIKKMLVEDKAKIKKSKLKQQEVESLELIIDMLANVLDSEDKDSIIYAYTAYKYALKSHPFLFIFRAKKVNKLIKDVLNELWRKNSKIELYLSR